MAEEIKKEEIAAEVENAEVAEKESTPEIEEKGKEVSDVRPGDTVKVHQKIKEKNKGDGRQCPLRNPSFQLLDKRINKVQQKYG